MQKGRKCSEETKAKMSAAKAGKNHPNYGKKLSDEVKAKISASNAGENNPNYGNKYSDEIKDKISKTHLGKKRSDETKAKIAANHADFSGEKNPQWCGGVSFEPYCPKFNKPRKEAVRDAYGRKCFVCGIPEEELSMCLDVHHTDYDKEQGCQHKEWALVPLCRSCHMKTNHNRDDWKAYFNAKLKALYE